MIELTVSGKKICFNLKDWETEKGLFNYWYAVSDMPEYRHKKLKILTDTGLHLLYEVSEIQNCIFIDKEYKKPEVSPEEAILDHIFEQESAADRIIPRVNVEELSREEIFDRYFPFKSDFSDTLKKLFCKLFDDIPKKKLDKVLSFMSCIRGIGYILDTTDPVIQDILNDLINDPDDEGIDPYLRRYIEYEKRKKFC